MKVIVSNEIEQICPEFVGACLEAEVVNTPYNEALWSEIEALGEKFRKELTTESLKELTSISATRRVYRAFGKDPSRYRPASEALIRRVLQGKELYQRDTLVDLVNLASIAYGYSIGGFDADKFIGDTLTLGIGREGEPYEGIGRGMINIQGLPVYRDAQGGVGTPTSDNERTKMSLETRHLLVLINGYDGNWCCIDWETGETNYEEKWTGGAGKGSIIAADDKLFIYDERRGFVGLVNPTPEKFDVVSKFRIAQGSGPYWAHMHIDNGILYLRHGEYFAAYKIK